jgi:hypothetical protein
MSGMLDAGFWSAAQVSEYFNGRPTVGTLNTWRTLGRGPRFVKLGVKPAGCKRDTRPVMYPVSEVMAWAISNKLQHQTEAA